MLLTKQFSSVSNTFKIIVQNYNNCDKNLVVREKNFAKKYFLTKNPRFRMRMGFIKINFKKQTLTCLK